MANRQNGEVIGNGAVAGSRWGGTEMKGQETGIWAEIGAGATVTSNGQPDTETAAGVMEVAPPPPRLEQPLLVVACGGSGGLVATQLKAILLDRFGAQPENAAILYFDSADDPISCREQRFGRVVTLERGSEWIRLKRVPVAGLKRNLQRNPEVMERLGDNLQRIHRPIIDDGAAMERPQGLLAVVWNASRIERALKTTLRRLTQREEDLRQALGGESRVNVVIVGSTGGGQGSGALLDLTYLAREKLAELGDLAESSRVVGMFVLPGAFVDVKGPNLLPNTHAFFLELDSLMQGNSFTARYPGGVRVSSSERPFDYVFVLDGVDEQGKTWPNREEVCALGAQALALLFGTEVGMREINNLVNESGVLTGSSDAGFGTYLATAGQAVIRFPAAQVAERCGLRQTQAMIDSLLAAPGAAARLASEEGAALGVSGIRDRLANANNGAPFEARLVAPAGLEQAPAEEIPTQARNLFANYLQRRVYDEDFAQIKAEAERVKGEVQGVLAQRLAGLLGAGRLLEALVWLRQQQEVGEQQLMAVVERQERLAKQVEQAQSGVDSASLALDRAAESFFVVRRSQMRSALSIYLDAVNELARLRLEQRVEQLVGETLRQLGQWGEGRLRSVEMVGVRLQQAREWLARHESELAQRPGGRSEITLAEPALVEHFFRIHAGKPAVDGQMAIAQTPDLLAWATWTPEEVGRYLLRYAEHNFAPILQMTVEDVLALRWHDRSAQQWIARLQALAAGAWNLDQARLASGGVDLASFLTLGVPDERQSSFANCGYTLVSTHDPERIVALRTVYGAALDMLKSMPLWQRVYEQVSGRTPVHILPHFQHRDDRGDQVFALGLVFGSIDQQAAWFYYRPEDRLDEPVRLGQGVENALATLRNRPDLQSEVMVRVAAEVARTGVTQAVAKIEAWVERGTGKGNGEETLKKLRRAARDYGEGLRGGKGMG